MTISEHWQPASGEVTDNGEDSAPVEFLQRWSRRKTAVARGMPEPDIDDAHGEDEDSGSPSADSAGAEAEESVEAVEPGQRIEPRTGKRYDDLTDADLPDPETLDESSDLRGFLARNISPQLRMKALTRVFHTAKYNKVCICAEYAGDYTSFEPMGDIVPHDMKAAIAREADKLRARLLDDGEDISREDAEARVLRETREGRAGGSARGGRRSAEQEREPAATVSGAAQGRDGEEPEEDGRTAAGTDDRQQEHAETATAPPGADGDTGTTLRGVS